MVEGVLGELPLPAGVTRGTLKEEGDIIGALVFFLQHDKSIASAILLKLENLIAALSRSEFIPKHVFLRSTMLIVYDDAAREDKMELKIMNFADSYSLPDGVTVTHTDEWDGTADNHEDGYVTGIKNLLRIMKEVEAKC